MMNKGFLARPSRKLVLVACLVLVLLLAFASTSYAAPAEAQQGVYHTVQMGEYLSLIASRYGVSTAVILAANPHITNPNLIYSGTNIFIPIGYTPAPPAPPAPPTYPTAPTGCRHSHYITPGQTMLGIAQFYGVSPFAIAQANNIFNLNRIYAGQTLCIP
jgi:LysM repeat protein